jgi:hypothetical protein
VRAILIEGATFEIGATLSPAVDKAVDSVAEMLLARFVPAEGETPCA